MKTASLLKDLEYNSKKPIVSVLFETTFTKEVRIAMKKGTLMTEHQTSFPIVVEIVEGNVSFGVSEKVLDLVKGDLLALDGGVKHDLIANEDSIIRLTLTKSDQTGRVENVSNK